MTLFRNMKFFDIHTHNYDADDNCSILNRASYITGRSISIGIHPWNIDKEWRMRLAEIEENADKENVWAIGECGIDKTNSPADIETQKIIFHQQAAIAEKASKPTIIHCVKGIDEIIAIHKNIKPKQAWIIHGFRGNRIQAEQLVKQGFYISLGERFNEETVRAIPEERLFIESDESTRNIADIYKNIAIARNISIDKLTELIDENRKKIMQF